MLYVSTLMEKILILNTILYLFAILFFSIKLKKNNLQIIIILWYCFISICGVFAIHSKVYFNIYGFNGLPDNSMSAFVYVFILFYILTVPLSNITTNNSLYINNQYFILPKIIFKVIMFVIISYFFLKLYEFQRVLSMNFGDIYSQLHEEGKAIITYSNPFVLKLSTSGYMIYNALFPFIVYYLLTKILNNKRNKYDYIFLAIVLLIKIFESVSSASRGGLVLSLFDYFFFIYIFWQSFNHKLKVSIITIAVGSIVLILMTLITITGDRVGTDSEYIFNSFTLYLGETFPNIPYRYWDHITYHPMGERLFGLRDYGSLGNFFNYWDSKLHVETACFKSLPIDLYIEFGKVGAFIFLIILSFVFKKIIGVKGLNIWSIGLIFWYYQLCIAGAFSFSKRGETNYKILLLIIIFSIYLYFHKQNILNNDAKHKQ